MGDHSSFWKVSIEQLKNNHWIAIGLIGKLQASHYSYEDKTSYNWTDSRVYIGGSDNKNYGGWNGFVSGDKIFFRYEPDTKILTMKVQRLGENQAFTLKCDDPVKAYINVNFYNHNDRIALEEIT